MRTSDLRKRCVPKKKEKKNIPMPNLSFDHFKTIQDYRMKIFASRTTGFSNKGKEYCSLVFYRINAIEEY